MAEPSATRTFRKRNARPRVVWDGVTLQSDKYRAGERRGSAEGARDPGAAGSFRRSIRQEVQGDCVVFRSGARRCRSRRRTSTREDATGNRRQGQRPAPSASPQTPELRPRPLARCPTTGRLRRSRTQWLRHRINGRDPAVQRNQCVGGDGRRRVLVAAPFRTRGTRKACPWP